MSKTEEQVFDLTDTIATEFGCRAYDVEFVKEGGDWFLRVFIQKDGNVSLTDCENVSRKLSDKLDEVDPIPQSYYLEVSSPGIERKLKRDEHILGAIGELVKIKLYKPLDGKKSLQGILKEYKNEQITIAVDEQEFCIPKGEIAVIKTIFV